MLYVTLFSLIINSGVLPAYNTAYIQKNGDSKSPEKYRPITILSCFGKLFASILNARLNDLSDAHTVLEENQAGFRAGYLTIDHKPRKRNCSIRFLILAKRLLLCGEETISQ